ncbi:unnamed protein product, partial [Prorocentrum cordatum]
AWFGPGLLCLKRLSANFRHDFSVIGPMLLPTRCAHCSSWTSRDFTIFMPTLCSLERRMGALGPDVQALWMKSPMHASAAHQHKPSTSELAAQNLVDWGVGPQRHEELSALVQHPFARDPLVESDLQFVVDAYVANGPRIESLRRARLRLVLRVARILSPLDERVLAQRHVRLQGAPGVRPVHIAFMVALMGWPDKGLPSRPALGFELAGAIPPSGILRPIATKHIGKGPEPEAGEEVFGGDACRCVAAVEAMRHPSKNVGATWDLTLAEISEGIADPMRTKDEMDSLHGAGRWRPLVRHVIWQADKWRPIDDGKRSRTNALSSTHETAVCIPPEFVIILLKCMALSFIKASGGIPPWFKPMVSLEDWWKGYRQLFPTSEHMGLAVVAVMCPETRSWLYAQLRGLPFGLGSAVNQFTRAAGFVTALNRRILLTLTGHYADDSPTVELSCLAGLRWSASNIVQESAVCSGGKYSASKHWPPSFMFNFLGHLHDLVRTCYALGATWGPKLHTRERLVEMCMAAVQSGRLSSGTAAKMRGLATWMDAALAVRVYTDAAADADRVRLGAKVILPDGRTFVTVLDADQCLRETWGPQDTVINQAELQRGALVAATFAKELRGQDVIWRVGNTSAATSLVKAGSPTATMRRLALQALALLAALGCRCWFDHVPSADNPADALSRDALDDPT